MFTIHGIQTSSVTRFVPSYIIYDTFRGARRRLEALELLISIKEGACLDCELDMNDHINSLGRLRCLASAFVKLEQGCEAADIRYHLKILLCHT